MVVFKCYVIFLSISLLLFLFIYHVFNWSVVHWKRIYYLISFFVCRTNFIVNNRKLKELYLSDHLTDHFSLYILYICIYIFGWSFYVCLYYQICFYSNNGKHVDNDIMFTLFDLTDAWTIYMLFRNIIKCHILLVKLKCKKFPTFLLQEWTLGCGKPEN